MNPQQLMYVPMSGAEMLHYNPDARLYKYPDLYGYNSIDDVFGHLNKIVLLYLTDSLHSGHWIGLFRKGNEITFFDSYGYDIDDEEQFVKDPEIKYESGECYKYLLYLLENSNYKINHNKYRLQAKNTQTCGRFVSLRLLNTNLNDDEFVRKYFSENVLPDLIVSKLIQ